jgi:citrate lyase subunit beta/citryl-CoA lyase
MSEVGKPAPTIDQAGIDHLRSWIARIDSADDKDRARSALLASELHGAIVRINGAGTAWFAPDLATLAQLDIAGVLVPKVEGAEVLETVRRALHPGAAVVATIETAAGLAAISNIAAAASRLAFGSIDFAADLNCSLDRDTLLSARTTIVLHSRLAGRPPPLDGVTLEIDDPALVAVDARYARGPEITALLERGRAWLAGGPSASADVLPSRGSD